MIWVENPTIFGNTHKGSNREQTERHDDELNWGCPEIITFDNTPKVFFGFMKNHSQFQVSQDPYRDKQKSM